MIAGANPALAPLSGWPYFMGKESAIGRQVRKIAFWFRTLPWHRHFRARMNWQPRKRPARKQPGVTLLAAVLAVAFVLVLGALGLWFHYGTEVFFDMIASDVAACL